MLAPTQAMLLFIAGILSIMTTGNGANGNCILGNTELKETAFLNSSGQYLDLEHPAPCNGNLTRWHLCYYASDIDQTDTYVVLFRIWRMINNSTFELVDEYKLNMTIEQSSNGDQTLICENVTLSTPLNVHRDDILGVYIPFTSDLGGPPLHIIARDTTDFGLFADTRTTFSVFTDDTISINNLERATTLGLNLHADIEAAEVLQSTSQVQLQLQPTPSFIAPTLAEPTSSTLSAQPQIEFTTTTSPPVSDLLTSSNIMLPTTELLSTAEVDLGLTPSLNDLFTSNTMFLTTEIGPLTATERQLLPTQASVQPSGNLGVSTSIAEIIGTTQRSPLVTEEVLNTLLATVALQNTPLVPVPTENTQKTPSIGVLAAIVAASVLAALVVICILLVVVVIACKKQKRKKANRFHPNATFYIDDVVYAGVMSDELSFKPDEESPFGSNVDPEQSVSSASILHQNGSVPTVTDQLAAQEYETPICTSISINSGEFLDSIANPNAAGHESKYISMQSDSQILQQYSLSRTKEDKQETARSSNAQSATESEVYSSLNDESSQYYKLLEQATEGTSESIDQYYAPPSNQQEILSAFSKQGIDMIPRKEIHTTTHLGSGQFGSVEKAIWKTTDGVTEVAVKTISAEALAVDKVRFLQEAAIMGQFRHPNVVRLNGVSIEQNILMLVLEYLSKGDLRKCLVKLGRDILPQDTPQMLLSYSQQVGLGMHYLASKGFVHRDLAARNVFVTEDNICKVGDFGMSRDLADAEYYISHGGKIPVRWTSPEAMYYRKYSTASDIWSYGCLLYEIWSLGRMPFKNDTNTEVIEKVDSGYRLPPPPGCPRIVYELMIKCWHPLPSSRPTFKDVLLTLLQKESEVLHIPVRDALTTAQASVLGSPIAAGDYMYPDLQKTYTTVSEKSDYDHITERKYILSFPTSSADIDSMYNDSEQRQSYRCTLLTSDTESDYDYI